MIVTTGILGQSTPMARDLAPMMTSLRISSTNPAAETDSDSSGGALDWINANKTTAALVVIGALAALFVIKRVL